MCHLVLSCAVPIHWTTRYMHGKSMGTIHLSRNLIHGCTYICTKLASTSVAQPALPHRAQSVNASHISQTCCLFFVSYSFVSMVHKCTFSIEMSSPLEW